MNKTKYNETIELLNVAMDKTKMDAFQASEIIKGIFPETELEKIINDIVKYRREIKWID